MERRVRRFKESSAVPQRFNAKGQNKPLGRMNIGDFDAEPWAWTKLGFVEALAFVVG